MKRVRRRATYLLCALTAVTFAGSAIARPVQKTTLPAASPHDSRSADAQPYPMAGARASAQTSGPTETLSRGQSRAERRAQSGSQVNPYNRASRRHAGDAFGGHTSNALVSQARAYMGTNPTGRSRAWCGAFLDMVLKKTGHAGGGNLARAYAGYGKRVSGPQVGAIAVMRNHVGVVSGIDPNGNPIIVSGNHNRTVAESVYPRGRIAAYVVP
ncbi:MAG: TIGR02594 family protein [Pseudolabrys sp.]|nr:TIGR02594 family protein [Pseudolabrys sp.]